MSDYLMNSLFAADLLNYLLEELDLYWEKPYTYIFEEYGKSEFSEDVGQALKTIWKRNLNDFQRCFNKLKSKCISDREAFSKCALSAADWYFSDGYSPESFLGYCAIVLAAATQYWAYPSNGVPERAVDVIALVLMAHQMTGQFYKCGGWEEIREISQIFNVACST